MRDVIARNYTCQNWRDEPIAIVSRRFSALIPPASRFDAAPECAMYRMTIGITLAYLAGRIAVDVVPFWQASADLAAYLRTSRQRE